MDSLLYNLLSRNRSRIKKFIVRGLTNAASANATALHRFPYGLSLLCPNGKADDVAKVQLSHNSAMEKIIIANMKQHVPYRYFRIPNFDADSRIVHAEFSLHISSTMIPTAQIHTVYTTDAIAVNRWIQQEIWDKNVRNVGFDCEWRAQTIKGSPEPTVAVVQLATKSSVLVYQCFLNNIPLNAAIRKDDYETYVIPECPVGIYGVGIPRNLAKLFFDRDILLVGVGSDIDINKCSRHFQLHLAYKALLRYQDLSAITTKPLLRSIGGNVVTMNAAWLQSRGIHSIHSLKRLAQTVLHINKHRPHPLSSNWHTPLLHGNIRYAAVDAWTSLVVYESIMDFATTRPSLCAMATKAAQQLVVSSIVTTLHDKVQDAKSALQMSDKQQIKQRKSERPLPRLMLLRLLHIVHQTIQHIDRVCDNAARIEKTFPHSPTRDMNATQESETLGLCLTDKSDDTIDMISVPEKHAHFLSSELCSKERLSPEEAFHRLQGIRDDFVNLSTSLETMLFSRCPFATHPMDIAPNVDISCSRNTSLWRHWFLSLGLYSILFADTKTLQKRSAEFLRKVLSPNSTDIAPSIASFPQTLKETSASGDLSIATEVEKPPHPWIPPQLANEVTSQRNEPRTSNSKKKKVRLREIPAAEARYLSPGVLYTQYVLQALPLQGETGLLGWKSRSASSLASTTISAPSLLLLNKQQVSNYEYKTFQMSVWQVWQLLQREIHNHDFSLHSLKSSSDVKCISLDNSALSPKPPANDDHALEHIEAHPPYIPPVTGFWGPFPLSEGHFRGIAKHYNYLLSPSTRR